MNATTTAYVSNLTTTPYVTPDMNATMTAHVNNLTATAFAITTPSPNTAPTQTPIIPTVIQPTQPVATVPTQPVATQPVPTQPVATPTQPVATVPIATPTVQTVTEVPTPAPNAFTYVLASQSISFDESCSGHYILGMVTAPDGAPLAGITVQAIDQYENWKTAVTKDNPLGQYDIPIPSDVTSYQVMVVSGAQQLSPSITIQHTEELSQSSNACHILNWRQTQ
jgi:hypothetical protein